MSLFAKQVLQLAIDTSPPHTACHISLQLSSETKALADTLIMSCVCVHVCVFEKEHLGMLSVGGRENVRVYLSV